MRKKLILAGIFFFTFLLFCFSVKALQIYKKINFSRQLSSEIKKEADSLDAKYSFLVKDLGPWGQNFADNENNRFIAASLIKLPILASAFTAISKGKISLNDIVIIKKEDIVFGSGKLKKCLLPYTLTFKELLELMITISDNTAANKAISLLGIDYINASFKEMGLKETLLARKMMDFSKRQKGIENYTSAADISFLLEKIYKKSLGSKELSLLAVSFLKKQKVNDRLPLYLPKTVIIAHKTGYERGVVNDAGIVFAPNRKYIICVLVEGKVTYRKAKKFIANASLLAYNLYNHRR